MDKLAPIEQALQRHRLIRATGITVGAILWCAGIVLFLAGRLPREICMAMGFVAASLFAFAKNSHEKLNSPSLGLRVTDHKLQRQDSAQDAHKLTYRLLDKRNLVARCEQYDRDLTCGRTLTIAPYASSVQHGEMTQAKCRRMNQALLTCLRNCDAPDLEAVEMLLLSRVLTFGKAGYVCLIFAGACAVGEAILHEMHLVQSLVFTILCIALISLCAGALALAASMKASQNLSCLRLWARAIEETET